MLVTKELTYKLKKECGDVSINDCVKALSNNSTYTDALFSLMNNRCDMSKIRKGSIVVITNKTGNINHLKEGTITKILSNKSKTTLLLDEYYNSNERRDVKIDKFENKKVVLLEDIVSLITSIEKPFRLKYNNRPCVYEFILNIRLATNEEKKKYHKLIKQIKY